MMAGVQSAGAKFYEYWATTESTVAITIFVAMAFSFLADASSLEGM
jgi:hypothetical protein